MAPAAQHSSCNMTNLKRSSLPAILLVGAGVGLALFYFLSPGYFISEQELHWIQRVKEINDKHSWTSKNCPKLMSLLIELCPCIANINPQQSVDDIEDSFVECVSTCISDDDVANANVNVTGYEDEDYKDEDYKDEEYEEGDASKSPATSAKAPPQPAIAGVRARPATVPVPEVSAVAADKKGEAEKKPGKSRRRR